MIEVLNLLKKYVLCFLLLISYALYCALYLTKTIKYLCINIDIKYIRDIDYDFLILG